MAWNYEYEHKPLGIGYRAYDLLLPTQKTHINNSETVNGNKAYSGRSIQIPKFKNNTGILHKIYQRVTKQDEEVWNNEDQWFHTTVLINQEFYKTYHIVENKRTCWEW